VSTGGEPQGRVLWLLRHAKAVTDPSPGAADYDRPLAPRGRRDAAALGRRISAGDLAIHVGPTLEPGAVVGSTGAAVGSTDALDAGTGRRRGRGPSPGVRPSYVLCSSARRTTETAQVVTEGLGLSIDRRRRLYYATPDDVLAELQTIDDGHRAVLVVGHNPATQLLALGLLTEQTPGRAQLSSLPTCGLFVIELDVARWQDVAMGIGRLAGFFFPPYDGPPYDGPPYDGPPYDGS